MAPIDALLATVIRGQDTEGVRDFINSGIDVNISHTEAGSALMAAALHGHMTMVKTLLALGADANQRHAKTLMNALHIASANGHAALIPLLLDGGARVDAQDNQRWTPLMFAAQEGHSAVIAALLAAGAALDHCDDLGCSALMQAARRGHRDAVQTLLEQGADANLIADWATPLVMAAAAGQVEVVQLLLDAGADVNFLQADTGYSALMLAALQGHNEVVNLLLAEGATPNLQTSWQVSALTMAQRGQQPAIAVLLIKAGASPAAETPQPVYTESGWIGDPMLVAEAEK